MSDAARAIRVAHVTLGLATGGQEKLLAEFARCADRTAPNILLPKISIANARTIRKFLLNEPSEHALSGRGAHRSRTHGSPFPDWNRQTS